MIKINSKDKPTSFFPTGIYLSPNPVCPTRGHGDKPFHQHLSYDKSTQCRQELVK